MSLLLPAAAAAAIIVIIQLVSGATGVMVRDPAAPSVLRRAGWYWRLGMLTALAILAGVDQFTPSVPGRTAWPQHSTASGSCWRSHWAR